MERRGLGIRAETSDAVHLGDSASLRAPSDVLHRPNSLWAKLTCTATSTSKARSKASSDSSKICSIAAGFILPFTPLAGLWEFIQPPAGLLATIILLVAIYLVPAEAMKRRLYRGHFDQQL